MNLARGTGLYVRRDQFGVVAKCPHCTRTNIPKVRKAQITCGGEGCRLKQLGVTMREPRVKSKPGSGPRSRKYEAALY